MTADRIIITGTPARHLSMRPYNESRRANLLNSRSVSPYKPAVFSARYSRIFRRTRRGKRGAESMRAMILTERPEPLCMPLRRVQVVLRESPNASACWSGERNPDVRMASATSRILAFCRARPGARICVWEGEVLPSSAGRACRNSQHLSPPDPAHAKLHQTVVKLNRQFEVLSLAK